MAAGFGGTTNPTARVAELHVTLFSVPLPRAQPSHAQPGRDRAPASAVGEERLDGRDPPVAPAAAAARDDDDAEVSEELEDLDGGAD